MAGSEPDREHSPPPAVFATTHWSVVLAAGQLDSPQTADALEKLCRTYWHPLYAYVRRAGYGPEDSQDLTQAFFASLLQKDAIARADPDRGRFRSFLLASLKHFLADHRDKARAQKRGGGWEWLELDTEHAEAAYLREPVDAMTPDRVYERRWAMTLMEEAMTRLRNEQRAAGTPDQFDILSTLLLDDSHSANYSDAARRLGLSANAVAAVVYRLRKRYRHLIRAEIAQTVAGPAEVEAELKHLLAAISG